MRARHGIAVTLGIGLLSLLGNAVAQNVISTQILGQPLVYMKDGALHGCGIRLIILDAPPNLTAAPVPMYDLSFNLQLPGYAMLKGGSVDIPSSDIKSGELKKGKEKRVGLASFWFKAKDKPATVPLKPVVKGEDAGTILYTADIEAVFALFAAQVTQEPVLVGVKRQGEKTERIFTGAITMPENEGQQVTQCVDEFLRIATK